MGLFAVRLVLLNVHFPWPLALGSKHRKGSDATIVPEYACSFTSPQVGPDPRLLLWLGDAIRSVPTLRSQGLRYGRKKTLITLESKSTIATGV
jgi:hypothetical protein